MDISGETPPSSSGEQSPMHISTVNTSGHAKSPRLQTSRAGRSTETLNVSKEQGSPATPISSSHREKVNHISYPFSQIVLFKFLLFILFSESEARQGKEAHQKYLHNTTIFQLFQSR